jgi:hypothetical protein
MIALLPAHLLQASAKSDELVLPYGMAQEALDALEAGGVQILGWEGWLRYADGRVGHSGSGQGTVDLSGMRSKDAYMLCRNTMAEANSEHERKPEREKTELLFCLTHAG